MPASYPGSVKNFTTKVDGVDDVQAAHVNDLQLEVTAVETDLFLNVPKKSISNLFVAPQYIGSTASKSSLPGITIARVLTDSGNARAFHDSSVFGGALQKAYSSFDAFAETGGANNLDHFIGFQSRNEHKGTGTLDKWYGFGSFPNITGGTLANCYGYYGADPIGGGSITNNYGIYLESMTAGDTNYAIYTNAGAISFGASITVRSGGLVTDNGGIVLVSNNLPSDITRKTALTTGGITLGLFLAKSTGNMTDGFGPVIALNVQDDTSASITLATIGAVRAGADNTGDLIVSTTAAGSSSEKLRVTSGGDVKVIAGRLYPVLKTTATAPAYEKGAIYFDTTLNKLRVGGASGWETVTSS